MIIRPTVQDAQILAFYESQFLQTTPEPVRLVVTQFCGSSAEDPNPRHRSLLAISRQRSSNRSQRDANEVPSPHIQPKTVNEAWFRCGSLRENIRPLG
jgi:hypothetical protein